MEEGAKPPLIYIPPSLTREGGKGDGLLSRQDKFICFYAITLENQYFKHYPCAIIMVNFHY